MCVREGLFISIFFFSKSVNNRISRLRSYFHCLFLFNRRERERENNIKILRSLFLNRKINICIKHNQQPEQHQHQQTTILYRKKIKKKRTTNIKKSNFIKYIYNFLIKNIVVDE